MCLALRALTNNTAITHWKIDEKRLLIAFCVTKDIFGSTWLCEPEAATPGDEQSTCWHTVK